MADITLKEFLDRAGDVTNRYLEICEPWSMEDQDKKIDEELFEFRTATSRTNELEEAWDVFFATITKLHLKQYHDYEILASGISTLRKIEKRSIKKFENFTSEVN